MHRKPASARGHNDHAIAICYVGGLNPETGKPEDTRTPRQKELIIKLIKQLKAKYPKATIFLENFLLLLWVAIGTIACWFFNPIIAIIYLIYALSMIYVILRKLICQNCYYYGKNCHVGWGKLASALFKNGDIGKF